MYNIVIWYLYILQNDLSKLLNTPIATQLQLFFYAMRTFKICFLSNLEIYITIFLNIVTILFSIFRTYLFYNWKLPLPSLKKLSEAYHYIEHYFFLCARLYNFIILAKLYFTIVIWEIFLYYLRDLLLGSNEVL